MPDTSTLNATDGVITANAAIVAAGTGGSIDIFVSNPTDVVIDINGYYAAQLPGVLGNPLGSASVALGEGAMSQGTSFRDTAIGVQALFNGAEADDTAIGYQALFNSQGINGLNTAIGSQSLSSYFGGFNNTAIGSRALYNYQFGEKSCDEHSSFN